MENEDQSWKDRSDSQVMGRSLWLKRRPNVLIAGLVREKIEMGLGGNKYWKPSEWSILC